MQIVSVILKHTKKSTCPTRTIFTTHAQLSNTFSNVILFTAALISQLTFSSIAFYPSLFAEQIRPKQSSPKG